MTQRHGETERVQEGFDGRLERGFEWLEDNARGVTLAVLALVVLGALSAGFYEWSSYRASQAQVALDRVERSFFAAMGTASATLYVTEPANREQAEKARSEALAGFEAVSADHPGSVADYAARIRAAEVEIGLGRLEDAQERLASAGVDFPDQPLRAAALRLRGYALEELGRFGDAAAAYQQAATVESYPAREELWLAAGESYLRAGDTEKGAAAFEEVLAIAPVYGERQNLVERLEALGVQNGDSEAAPAVEAESPGSDLGK